VFTLNCTQGKKISPKETVVVPKKGENGGDYYRFFGGNFGHHPSLPQEKGNSSLPCDAAPKLLFIYVWRVAPP